MYWIFKISSTRMDVPVRAAEAWSNFHFWNNVEMQFSTKMLRIDEKRTRYTVISDTNHHHATARVRTFSYEFRFHACLSYEQIRTGGAYMIQVRCLTESVNTTSRMKCCGWRLPSIPEVGLWILYVAALWARYTQLPNSGVTLFPILCTRTR